MLSLPKHLYRFVERTKRSSRDAPLSMTFLFSNAIAYLPRFQR